MSIQTMNEHDKIMTDEHAVIGCIIMDENCAFMALHKLSVDDFTGELSKEMFAELKELYAQYKKIDPFIISHSKNYESMTKCVYSTPSISSCDIYIRRIKEHRIQSQAKNLALEIIDNNLSIEEIAEKAGEIARISTGDNRDTKTETMPALLCDFLETHICGNETEYFHIGLGLDSFVKIRKGNYVVIGARPSVGKTALSIQIALELAKNGHKILYCSLETKSAGIIERAISCYGHFDFDALQNNGIDWNDVNNCTILEEMAHLPIGVNDKINNLDIIESVACAGAYDVVIIDYMSLLELGKKTSSIYERVTETSIALHKMAQKNNLLVIALCQLNRAGAGAPRLEHLRESGQIEQDADVVMMLHNEIEMNDYGEEEDNFSIIVEKNKTGKCGKIKIDYNKEKQHFYEIDNRRE